MKPDSPKTLKDNTVILHTAALIILPMQLLLSIFLLLRGHDEPGGGFIGGLVASSAIVLYLLAHGVAATRKLIRVDPHDLLGFGLLLGVLAVFPGLLAGEAFFTALWWEFYLGPDTLVKLSTVLLFDIGVYFAVMGTILTIVVSLAEAEHS